MSYISSIRVAGLLFDNDGVLIDSTEAVNESWRAFAHWYDLPESDVLGRVHGRRSRDVIEHYADRLPVSVQQAHDRYLDACVHDFTDVTLLPGVEYLLATLPRRGWAIVTSGTRTVAQARWRAAGMPEPPELVTAEDVTHGKPDPEPYRLAARRLGLEPRDCLVIEDAPAGLSAAHAAGCPRLALLTTHESDELEAELIATDLAHITIDTTTDFHVTTHTN